MKIYVWYHDQLIAAQHETLEMVQPNSRALFSLVFFSQSALAMTLLFKASVGHQLLCRVWNVVTCGVLLRIQTQHGFLEEA